jgi:hypothetical protein
MNSSQTDMGLIQFQPQHCESILIFNRVNELTVITSGVGLFRGGRAVVRPRPPFGVVYAGGGLGPPPFDVIRGAVVGVWLGFLPGSREGSGKCEKLLKKVVKMFWDGNLWRLVAVLKKVVKYFDRPLLKFLNTPLAVMYSLFDACFLSSRMKNY